MVATLEAFATPLLHPSLLLRPPAAPQPPHRGSNARAAPLHEGRELGLPPPLARFVQPRAGSGDEGAPLDWLRVGRLERDPRPALEGVEEPTCSALVGVRSAGPYP